MHLLASNVASVLPPPATRSKCKRTTYLSNAPDVLVTVFLAESKILVQSKSHIVAIETVGSEAKVQQVLLKGSCDCGLSRCRETSEPNGETRLLA